MESFSERMGYKEIKFLKHDEVDEALSHRMFDLIIYDIIDEKFVYSTIINGTFSSKEEFKEFTKHIIIFFKDNMHKFDKSFNENFNEKYSYDYILDEESKKEIEKKEYIEKKIFLKEYLEKKYNILEWYEKYDLMEFLIKNFYDNKLNSYFADNLVKKLNNILEEEKTAYRVINYKITLITDKLELEAVNNTLTKNDGNKITSHHIHNAIDALSKKPEGDYNKVITSSVLALEGALKESLDIKGNDRISIKTLIGKFQEKYKVNKFITEPINQFIGILRGSELALFHSAGDNTSSKEIPFKATFMEAKYILVMSCNFLNYIKSLNT